MSLSYAVAALYRFTPFPDPAAIQMELERDLADLGLCGTLIIAEEGINGTIAAAPHALDRAIGIIRALPGCGDIEIKHSQAASRPFRRFKVRMKREIVTMGCPEANPNRAVGTYVAPEDWNDLISDPDTVVIDTRNAYEVDIGTFEGAVNPKTISFRAFPNWFQSAYGDAPPKRVAMFCTGGIRCEKATSLVKQMGIEDVFHLKGGILKYLETVPEAESRWQGECFVFDERVSVGHGLKLGTARLCRACKYPVLPEDLTHPHYEPGVSCRRCFANTSAEQKARFRERQHQIRLAEARGEAHFGSDDAITR